MDPYHERLARIALAVADDYGFALAGGYAVQLAGILERPSDDIDLFTIYSRRGEFSAAVRAIVEAYTDNELRVDIDKQLGEFARLFVTDLRTEERSKVELGVDFRVNEPVMMEIGPVLHPDDAVRNKMSALFNRALARDFVDIYRAITSGRYDRKRLFDLAVNADPGFHEHALGMALGRASVIDDASFAEYGVAGPTLPRCAANSPTGGPSC